MKLATAAQMKELDNQAIEKRGIPSLDLMERAAAAVTEAALEVLPRKPSKCTAAVLCGAGNNGGDGIAAARGLFAAGVRVRVFLTGTYEKLTFPSAAWSWSLLTPRMTASGPGSFGRTCAWTPFSAWAFPGKLRRTPPLPRRWR